MGKRRGARYLRVRPGCFRAASQRLLTSWGCDNRSSSVVYRLVREAAAAETH